MPARVPGMQAQARNFAHKSRERTQKNAKLEMLPVGGAPVPRCPPGILCSLFFAFFCGIMSSCSEQFLDRDFKFRQQFLGKNFTPGQDAFEDHPVLGGMVHLDVVITRINHPQPRESDFFVDLFFDDGVRSVVLGIDDLGREPEFVARHAHEREIRPEKGIGSDANCGTGREQGGAVKIGDAGLDQLVQAGADLFVALARAAPDMRRALQQFLIRLTHGVARRSLLRKRPVCEFLFFAICSGVPSATIWPPPPPPSGPRSMTQSASAIRSKLCSMTMTEWPASTSRCNTSTSLRTSAMCKPIVGSSRTKRLRRARGSNKSGSLKPASK